MDVPLFESFEEKVDPAHTALVVVDMQNDYLAEGGFFDEIGYSLKDMQAMAPRLGEFIETARSFGVPIVWTRNSYDPVFMGPTQKERSHRRGEGKVPAQSGTWGQEFYVIQPKSGDVIIHKHRFDAFEGTNLDVVLKSNGIHSLLMTGVTTECCVQSTARRGFFLGYYIVLVEDCASTYDPSFQEYTKRVIDDYFGVVCNAQEVRSAWAALLDEKAAQAAPAAKT